MNNNKPTAVKRDMTIAKKMGLYKIIASMFFFFNPCLNIIDILPDFFGCMLLISGLMTWADLCPEIMDAVQGLQRLRWIYLAKLLMIALVPLVDDTFVLIFTFSFSVVESIYLFPSIARIFNGFEYFGTRYDGKAIYVNYKNTRTITNIFFAARAVLCVLPELCSLSDYEYSGYVTSGVQIDYAQYKPALLVGGIVITLLCGIMWLINAVPYFIRIFNDTEFMTRVYNQYELEIGGNIGLHFRRTLATVVALMSAGFIFFINFWIDEINIIPNFIGGIFLAVAIAKLSKYSRTDRVTLPICIVFSAVSAVSFGVSTVFSVFYSLESVMHEFEAYDLYNITRVFSAVEYLLMFVMVFCVFRELRRLIDMHLGADPDLTDRRLIDIYASQQHSLDVQFTTGIVIFFVTLVLNLVYFLFRAEFSQGVQQFWLVTFLANGFWWIYMKSALSQLYSQIEYKYM